MLKVKMFEGINEISDFEKRHGAITIEEKINDFLSKNPNIEIQNILQCSNHYGSDEAFSSYITVSLLYRT
ncbi:hypothetical protein M2139_000309 [Enterococcus sp. PF1-24]|uniref:hypothetical protein n=1 Tax=unclassified Enterococcus TaxID=2608891 RepID=UPI002472E91B|nr:MULTISPECIES: hypothetical protein [unclassified Enterococcus]MDH6363271.1 hypothetical protein [Enterococcus sp. PFB1-1]MDH6400428.1 hypothetical protein [Enterococcus sp. PF1-24]